MEPEALAFTPQPLVLTHLKIGRQLGVSGAGAQQAQHRTTEQRAHPHLKTLANQLAPGAGFGVIGEF